MKNLPFDDFRALRSVLEPSDFALGPHTPDPPPRDLIKKETWNSITSLTDDVSIRTSNDYGSLLTALWDYWEAWLYVAEALAEANTGMPTYILGQIALDCADEFQGSIFNAMVGFYRIAFSSLRNVLENMTVGTYLDLKGDTATTLSWLAMNEEKLGFGKAADALINSPGVRLLEDHLTRSVGDDLFRQKTPTRAGGFARRLFVELSKFTHAIPKHTSADLWESNGPVFVPEAFERWSALFLKTYAIALVEARMAQPNLKVLPSPATLTAPELFSSALSNISAREDGHSVLSSVPFA